MTLPLAVVVMAGPTGMGISGGDVHAARLALAWHEQAPGRVVVAAPTYAMNALGIHDGMRRPLDTWLDQRVTAHLEVYLAALIIRMWRTAWLSLPVEVAVASSHLFHDVIPCVALKYRRGSRIVAYVYHLISRERPRPSRRDRASILLERLSLRLLARHGALVFVDDRDLVEPLLEAGIQPTDVVVTANAYDPVESLPDRRRRVRPTVVFCGRLVAQKGVWDVLELARRFASGGRDADVVILGDGPEAPALREQARVEGLEHFHVLGFVPEREKWTWLRSADVFVSPSCEEGWGIAVGEAVLAGVPAVAYDLPAYRHLEGAIITVPVGDMELMTREVERLLDDETYRAGRIARADHRLPTWAAVLSSELGTIEDRCG